MIFGPRTAASDSKMRTKRLKFVLFCEETGALPLLPTKPANLFRFMLWLPQNGVRSGWKGCLAYVTEVVNWNKQLGFEDPRESIEYYWTQFRNSFKRLVTAEHRAVKLPIRPAMLEAMALDANLRDETDLRDICAYMFLFYTGLDLSKYSGVSFRKGCLSTLGALNVPAHRLADHADHATVESSRIYTVDTVGERAANSVLIGSVFRGVR